MYRQLCVEEKSIPIFSQDWWLDSLVGPENWDVVLVENGGQIQASIPYVIRKRFGLTTLVMPPLTQTLGPWLRESPPGTKHSQRLAREKDLAGELFDQLPFHDYFAQNFSPEITNWLPWHWKGYQQTTRYTYRLEDLLDLGKIWDGLQTKIRGDIRKAEKQGVEIVTDMTIENFLPLNKMTFKRQGEILPYSKDLVRRLDSICVEKTARKIFIARDQEGRYHAGVYLVYTNHAAYNLMIGGDPELRNSGATSLAMWEAIKFSSTVTKTFDFEGSMIEPVERFFRGFGARLVPYFSIWKHNTLRSRIFQTIRKII